MAKVRIVNTSTVAQTIRSRHVQSRNAECVAELLQTYRELPRGQIRNVVCATMNRLANAIVDLDAYLNTGVMTPDLEAELARQAEAQNPASKGV